MKGIDYNPLFRLRNEYLPQLGLAVLNYFAAKSTATVSGAKVLLAAIVEQLLILLW
jgi:hypothetical protein